ncbi:penicillin acylase family protein [Candidatus Palauibacter sp.]|uniref:penicillin acylase family protein n=1 Tax=Candidatus Palauibacter sp. TaxID=3101350 RepID=UPI003C6F91C2
MTTGAPDVADCYEVEVDPADSLRYRYDGEWRRMETHEAAIEVRGGETVTRSFTYTRHNAVLSPVIARQDGNAWVVSTAYMHTAGDFDQEVYEINQARSVAEVKEAMRRLGMFPQKSQVMVGGNLFDARTLTQMWPIERPYGPTPWTNDDITRADVRSDDYWDGRPGG